MLNLEQRQELIQVMIDLIRLNSSNPPGDETAVADYIVAKLEENGIPARIYSKAPNRPNVYAEIGGGELPPILLLSHIDVVPAPGEWKHPPFEGVNDNGVIYGRGAIDTKHLTAMEMMSMIWLKRSGVELNRKVILLATADEEGGSSFGMGYIEQEHPELLPPGYVLSEGGGFVIQQGDLSVRTCTCGEKGRVGIQVCAKGHAGNSTWDTPAGQLLQALRAIAEYEAPEERTGPTDVFYEVVGGRIEDKTLRNLWEYSTKGNLAADAFDLDFSNPETKPVLNFSYQYIDGTTKEQVDQLTARLLGQLPVEYEVGAMSEGYTCDVGSPFFTKLREVSEKLDPGTQLLPMIALGRTDGRFIRKDVFGYSPLLADLPFSEVLKMVHQPNERITEDSLEFGAAVIYKTLLETAVEGTL